MRTNRFRLNLLGGFRRKRDEQYAGSPVQMIAEPVASRMARPGQTFWRFGGHGGAAIGELDVRRKQALNA